MRFGTEQIVLLCVGALLALAGLWVLIALRPGRRAAPLHITDSGDIKRFSEPTRLLLGLLLLLTAYHAAVWGWSERLTAVQLNRRYWYIWILIGIIGIGVSLILDQVDRNDTEGGDTGS